jgi:UDP-N-acetylglucosamine--N-acetylmuramyl-(pentapeptide) pyrophosphoryl-undecaprenol N-acetylglucosamine transferase
MSVMEKDSSKELRFGVACGGTGGHVFPALAIAEAIEAQGGPRALFFGRADSMESRLLMPRPFEPILTAKRSQPIRLLRAILHNKKVLKSQNIRFLVATGGFVAFAVCVPALMLGIPLYLQEPNAIFGLANKLLQKRARKTFVAGKNLGNPVRKLPGTLAMPSEFSSDKFNVLVTGGSQGAAGINKKILAAVERIASNDKVRVVWQVGKGNFDEIYSQVREKLTNKLSDNLFIKPFLENIYAYEAHADLVIARAGASTLAEILVFGKPSILCPYPYAAANHQEHNARALQAQDAALVELDSDPDDLWNKVERCLKEKAKVREMAQKASALGKLNRSAASVIAHDILEDFK